MRYNSCNCGAYTTDLQVSRMIHGNREQKGENLTLQVKTDLNIENTQKEI